MTEKIMHTKPTKDSKISLFTKSYTIKAYLFFLLAFLIVSTPSQVNAGFFDFIIGLKTQAADTNVDNFGTDNFSNNSQNIPLLESSIDPDMKNATNGIDINTYDGALSVDSNSPFGKGMESDFFEEMRVYEVKSGDTLSEIADLYDVSLNTIKWENNLTTGNIKIGQKLNILPVTGVKHIIKKGDNLDKIATKYEADVTDIMVFNDVSKTEGLKVGDILYVPNGIIKPAAIADKPSSKNLGSSPSYTPSTVASGYYLRPVNGYVTSPYGSRRRGFHYGIDIGVSRGSTVLAAATGRVIETVGYCIEGRSSCGGRYGNYVMIQHLNGTITRYAHLSKVLVSVGDSVSQGEQIAKSGNTGRSTGPHIHFQIEKSNGSTIRPVF